MALHAVSQGLLTTIAGLTYSGGHFLDPATGAARYLHVSPLSGAWELAASGDTCDAATAAALHGATATSHPLCFKTAAGAYKQLDEIGGVAVAESWPGPPPR